ncbi:MAG: hypothetical protein M1832_003243 [Thelocarpon impressellum]|nr:MAG: hypothetical protein M1832_003243 [Thelocarpon impressellum]
MLAVETFPSLSEEAFSSACHAFVEQHRKARPLGCPEERRSWDEVTLENRRGQPFISIKRLIRIAEVGHSTSSSNEAGTDSDHCDDEIESDGDAEALDRQEYHVLLSPTYRVPVLYFSLGNLPLREPLSLDTAYELLVPPQYKEGLGTVGVLGGISMGDHPLLDTPAFFIHPCNTADAMRELGDGRDVNLFQYLMLWIGLVGSGVGFHMPTELVMDRGNDDTPTPGK